MEEQVRKALRGQYGALIQMLRNAIEACPEEVWGAKGKTPSFNHMAYHAIFYLDFYSGDSPEMLEAFTRQPFTEERDEDLDEAPSKTFTKEELLSYLDIATRKYLDIGKGLGAEDFARPCAFHWKKGLTVLDLLLQNLRHLNHHIGQLNYILRLETGAAPTWVGKDFDG